MNKEEFNLSEKIESSHNDINPSRICTYDVKEFIKIFNDNYFFVGDCKTCKEEYISVDENSDCFKCVIKELAGDKLT